MSTWTEVVYYIKTQLKPGVLGHTDVQKILNAILAVIQQVNAGDYSPTNAALWKAEVSYASDVVPVLWQDNWLVSNTAGNLGNVPISTSGVLHPSWRIIGSSPGSGIRIWEPIVYPNTLEMVFSDGALYYLNRAVVGSAPFVSVDFAGEVSGDIWLDLMKDHNHDDRYFTKAAITAFLEEKEPTFSKNTAFNKNFGTAAGTVPEGNDSRILNGQSAFSWGNHAGLYALLSHVHTIAQVTGLQGALDGKEAAFTKNTAFNKSFGTAAGTVAEGNDSRINNGQTAFGWGNHAGLYALLSHVHTIAQVTGLQGALDGKEAAFTKNTAFNKNFGTAAGSVAQGNDSRINNGQTAFGWGNHSGLYALVSHHHDDRYFSETEINNFFSGSTAVTGYNKSNWDTAFTWGNHAGLYAPVSHVHTIAQVTGLQGALDGKEASFTKNTAFNKNFGTASGSVAQGNDSRINNGQTAFGWGNHAGLYVPWTSVAQSGASKVLQTNDQGYLLLDNWVRVSAGTGLYSTTGHYFSHNQVGYNGWRVRSNSETHSAITFESIAATVLGAVYADTLGNIGFTNSTSTNWRLRVSDTGAYFPSGVSRYLGNGNSSGDQYVGFLSTGGISYNVLNSTKRHTFLLGGSLIAEIGDTGISSANAISTAAPYGGSIGTWRLGTAEVAASPFANRTIRVQIGNQYYDILAAYGGTVPV